MQTFCASPNNSHLRADCSLCNTTLKPLTTKIQCYTVLIYSTCNQIKTSSCSSSYSRYYELVYLSLCVFSGRALTVVLQKIIITNTSYDLILPWNLCGELKANFSTGFFLFLCNTTFRFIPQWSRICCCLCKDCHMHEIIRMHFYSRTSKIVRTFFDRGSVTKKTFTILVYIKKKKNR